MQIFNFLVDVEKNKKKKPISEQIKGNVYKLRSIYWEL